jgi:hypothetical protein
MIGFAGRVLSSCLLPSMASRWLSEQSEHDQLLGVAKSRGPARGFGRDPL